MQNRGTEMNITFHRKPLCAKNSLVFPSFGHFDNCPNEEMLDVYKDSIEVLKSPLSFPPRHALVKLRNKIKVRLGT